MKPATRQRFRIYLAGAAIVLASVSFTAVASQDPELSRDPSGFAETVDVELVNVEAWVTDRKGRSVTGLGVEDFEVFEDGVRVTISHFAEIEDPLLATGELATRSPAAETETVEGTVEDPGHLVLFFDESQLAVGSRKRVIKALREFLDMQQVAAERILVLRYFETVSTEALFGSSADEIRAAVDRLAAPSATFTRRSLEKQLLMTRLETEWEAASLGPGDPCLRFVKPAVAQVRAFTEESRVWVSNTFRNLGQVVTFLAGTPGVKTLVYISDGLELRPGADLRAFVDTTCPPRSYRQSPYVPPTELGGAISRLARHANSNRVTIYTLQSSGLKADSEYGAERAGTSSLPAVRAWARESRIVERDGLVTLANQTGGRASFNTNGFTRIFQEIAGYMSTYYSLAYVPTHRGDGGAHKIEVKVKKPKTRVRHRQGYIDKSSDERMTERLESALYLGTLSNPLAARLVAGEIQAGGGGRFAVPVRLQVPVQRVVFLPHYGRDVAQLRSQIAIHDHQSGKLDLKGRIFRAERPASDHETLDFSFDLDLETGRYEVAVALRDVASGETSYIKTSVAVGLDDAEQ